MKNLNIYPTSRALRTVSSRQKEQSGFLPSLMRIDEFEQRIILLKNKIQIDPLKRILFLRKASNFDAFQTLKVNRELVHFFTKSDILFKFFEELAGEKISFKLLAEADAYAEFESHLKILEIFLKRYHKLLDDEGFTDKAFIPSSYELNIGFIKSYEKVEIFLEGYLSQFELELMQKVSEYTELIIHYVTSDFNIKMQERFTEIGIKLKNNSYISFNMSNKEIISSDINTHQIDASIFAVEEREEQIAIAFAKIEEMVKSGISPDNIALILPDEKFKEHFKLFDTHNNLNFAMGDEYKNGRIYKSLDALYRYWQGFDKQNGELLERYGFKLEEIDKITNSKKTKLENFFDLIDNLGLHESSLIGKKKKKRNNKKVYEKYLFFIKVFGSQELRIKEWLFLWLKSLSKITIDDVNGGKITVMGLLETRGVVFEGVVIVDFNEGIVPTSLAKDQFLNSSVRAFAKLPTKADREALQKQYYKRLVEEASKVVILYTISDNRLPSKFLYELELDRAIESRGQFNLLYPEPSQLISKQDPIVDNFDAFSIIWSSSRLTTYLECKRKYYYKYSQKIKEKKTTERNEGVFLHTLLDHLYREKDSYDSYDEMKSTIDRLLDELLPFHDAKTAYDKLLWKEKLKGFITSQIEHFKADWRVVAREEEFEGEIGGLKFTGRIDRIDQNSTDTLLLDYKSGSIKDANKIKNLDTLIDFQMSIYYNMLTPKYQNLKLAFIKILEKGEVVEITALEEKNQILGEHIIALKQTKKFVASRCEELKKCKYCEFQLVCERGEYL